MWPSNTNGNDPSYCGAKFVASELDPIMSQLQKQWPSYQGQDDSFWSHEFEKHGSCACSLPVRSMCDLAATRSARSGAFCSCLTGFSPPLGRLPAVSFRR